MNFAQLHERLRLEMVRRVEREILSCGLLALQTGLTPAHISNFLHQKRMLSLAALDEVLRVQRLTVEDLFPEAARATALQYDSVPLVAPSTAIHDPYIASNSILDVIKVRSGLLDSLREKCSARRRNWERFVAVQITEKQAESMRPIVPPRAILLIDRHYVSPLNYLGERRTIYAVRDGNLLRFRYIEITRSRLVLRPYNRSFPIEVLDLSSTQSVGEFLVGRIFLTIAEL